MLFPLIGVRLHAWLDETVAPIYLLGAWWLGLTGMALILVLAAAAWHFLLTRFTDYPRGTWRRLRFTTHAFLELGEGLVLMAGLGLFLRDGPLGTRLFVGLMGGAQLVAFAFSRYDT